MVFAECSLLQEIKLGNAIYVTFRSLLSVVRCRLVHLRRFCWTGFIGITEQDVKKFCALARDKGLLPVPVVEAIDASQMSME